MFDQILSFRAVFVESKFWARLNSSWRHSLLLIFMFSSYLCYACAWWRLLRNVWYSISSIEGRRRIKVLNWIRYRWVKYCGLKFRFKFNLNCFQSYRFQIPITYSLRVLDTKAQATSFLQTAKFKRAKNLKCWINFSLVCRFWVRVSSILYDSHQLFWNVLFCWDKNLLFR